VEAAIIRLAERSRKEIKLLPPRPPEIVGAGLVMLASLPGIGIERAQRLLEWGGGMPAHALTGLTDLSIQCPAVGEITRKKIRAMLGLKDRQTIALWMNNNDEEVIDVIQEGV
jgi:hypothetical protein